MGLLLRVWTKRKWTNFSQVRYRQPCPNQRAPESFRRPGWRPTSTAGITGPKGCVGDGLLEESLRPCHGRAFLRIAALRQWRRVPIDVAFQELEGKVADRPAKFPTFLNRGPEVNASP